MKVVIAMDSFKGSMSSLEAGEAVAEGIRRADEQAETVVRPLADGGEGTMDALVRGMGGEIQRIRVTGPYGRKVECRYGIIEKRKLAVIEMAEAAGLTLVAPDERNPLYATTYGVGEVICDAAAKGCRRFLVGIGGSATNDGGAGMLQALGYGLLDGKGEQVPFGAQGLRRLQRITSDRVLPELSECEFLVACDVENPLCGELGCSAVYGPQKGANPVMIADMDRWLLRYAQLADAISEMADPYYPGAGAAGGMGFAFRTFLHASLRPGAALVLEETGLEEAIKTADLVITGEGQLDRQTMMGKAVAGVAKIARTYRVPVLAFAGSVTKDVAGCTENGIAAYFPILHRVCTLEEAMKSENARENLADTAEQAIRLLRVGMQIHTEKRNDSVK